MTDEDIQRAIEVVREATSTTGPRGHVALVAGDNRFDALLLMDEIGCAEIGVRFIRVFRQRGDAERWLDVMPAARNLRRALTIALRQPLDNQRAAPIMSPSR